MYVFKRNYYACEICKKVTSYLNYIEIDGKPIHCCEKCITDFETNCKDIIYKEARIKNSRYELRCLMEDYLKSNIEANKEIILKRIKNLIP